MIIDGTNGLTFNNATTQASAGQILQVVNVTYGTFTSFTTSTFVDSGLSASITPKFSTSKILVQVCLAGCGKTGTDSAFVAKLVRGSTTITNMEGNGGSTGNSSTCSIGTVAISYLDSPATTSSTTYKVQCLSASNASSTRINDYYSGTNPSVSTITLMEVA
jgi:hypothetical protein